MHTMPRLVALRMKLWTNWTPFLFSALSNFRLPSLSEHGPCTQAPPNAKPAVAGSKRTKAPASQGAPGGWLTSGKLGVSTDDDEGEDERAAAPVETSAASTKRNSLGQGMPSWAAAKPVPSPRVEPAEDKTPKVRGLGGGRPPWAPALPEPVSASAKGPSASNEETQNVPEAAAADAASHGSPGIPDWLATAATHGTAQKVGDVQAGSAHTCVEIRRLKVLVY